MSDQISEAAAAYTTYEERLAAEAELIKRWIEPHPRKPGRAEAVLVKYGVSVWVLINLWESVDGDVMEVARIYDLPEEAERAALAYYRQNKYLIDARIALYNDEASA
jgi:hypothetical protein